MRDNFAKVNVMKDTEPQHPQSACCCKLHFGLQMIIMFICELAISFFDRVNSNNPLDHCLFCCSQVFMLERLAVKLSNSLELISNYYEVSPWKGFEYLARTHLDVCYKQK